MWRLATASPRHHLLIRRHLQTGELAFCYCYLPEGQPVSLSWLVRAAGLRWTGDAATKPVHAGTTSEHDLPAAPS